MVSSRDYREAAYWQTSMNIGRLFTCGLRQIGFVGVLMGLTDN